MSNPIQSTRTDPSEKQLIEHAKSRRTLFSSFGILMSSGVVALTALPSMAHARSALDDMAWAPSSATGAQPVQAPASALVPEAPRLAMNEGMTQAGAPQLSHSVIKALAAAVQTVSARQAAEPVPQPIAEPAVRPIAQETAQPARASRSFADLGLGDSVEQGPDRMGANPALPAARVVVDTPAQPVVMQSARKQPAAAVARAQAAPISIASSPVRPSLTINPPRDMQADLNALRRTVASDAGVPADGAPGTAARPVPSFVRSTSALQSAAADVSVPRASMSPKASRKSDTDAGYADWLDDSTSAKALADRSVVPENVVRRALRNAADTAAERSASVRQARNDWEAAKFDVDQVKGQRWPQVQVGGNSPALQGSNNSFDDSNRASANINVTTMVYDWGKTSKNIDSRTKTAEAAEFYYKTVAQQNAYEVSSSLVDLAKYRAVYTIGESYVKRMAALVEMLDEIVKVDPGRLSELSQAKARLLQAQTSQETVAAQVHSLELSVRKLIGDQPAAMPHGTQWQLPLDGLEDSVAAVAQNPAIEQAMAEAAAASATAKSVRAASLPQLNWVINKTTAHDSFNQRQPWTTMLQLTWTPFQGGSQQAAERAALARASSSSDKREQLQLDSEFKVRDAHRDAIAMAARAKLYGELSVETDVVRKQFFEQWYHLNRRTLVDVLSAESDFYNNQVSQVTTQFDAYQDFLKVRLNNGTLAEWLLGA